MSIKLVSFTVCPFVQRAVLALREKDAEFEIDYIDLRNKPEWFLKLSPRGKVPILIVDAGQSGGEQVLFESMAICQYLEETIPSPALFPADPILRARDRAWCSYCDEMIMSAMWGAESAKTKEAQKENLGKIADALKIVDAELEGRDWLSGDGSRFGMADLAFAPLMWRDRFLGPMGFDALDGLKNVEAWRDRMLARPTLAASVPEQWESDYRMMGAAIGSAFMAA